MAFQRRQPGLFRVQAEEAINTLATDRTRVPRRKEVGQSVPPSVQIRSEQTQILGGHRFLSGDAALEAGDMNTAGAQVDVLAQQEANLRGAQSEGVHGGKQCPVALVCNLGKEPLNLPTGQGDIFRAGLLLPGFCPSNGSAFLT